MLSLAPRFDLFRLLLPKDFIPEELNAKYTKLLTSKQYPLSSPLEYLSESLVSCDILGIDDLVVMQRQTGINMRMHRVKTEPTSEVPFSVHTAAPLEKLNRTIDLSFRMNQGFYNYFMLYEILFWRFCKPEMRTSCPQVVLYMLNTRGEITTKLTFYDVFFQGIDGLDFSYANISRMADTFSLSLAFNDIKIETNGIFDKTESVRGTYLGTLEKTE